MHVGTGAPGQGGSVWLIDDHFSILDFMACLHFYHRRVNFFKDNAANSLLRRSNVFFSLVC